MLFAFTLQLALNHLVIIGKYFLYVKALNGKFYIFNEFVSLARDKISLEKYISCFPCLLPLRPTSLVIGAFARHFRD